MVLFLQRTQRNDRSNAELFTITVFTVRVRNLAPTIFLVQSSENTVSVYVVRSMCKLTLIFVYVWGGGKELEKISTHYYGCYLLQLKTKQSQSQRLVHDVMQGMPAMIRAYCHYDNLLLDTLPVLLYIATPSIRSVSLVGFACIV